MSPVGPLFCTLHGFIKCVVGKLIKFDARAILAETAMVASGSEARPWLAKGGAFVFIWGKASMSVKNVVYSISLSVMAILAARGIDLTLPDDTMRLSRL